MDKIGTVKGNYVGNTRLRQIKVWGQDRDKIRTM